MDSIQYLALGDSYTIGEAVAEPMRWPNQLARLLKDKGLVVQPPRIVAKTGWTTGELSDALDTEQLKANFELVSLLIGVNNQYRGLDIADYQPQYRQLLNRAIGYAAGQASRVFAVSIPDYGETPYAKNKELDAKRIARELDQYNSIAQDVARELGVIWIDVTEISRRFVSDAGMLAEDGLHPSGAMYRLWAEKMVGPVRQLLR